MVEMVSWFQENPDLNDQFLAFFFLEFQNSVSKQNLLIYRSFISKINLVNPGRRNNFFQQ